MCTLGGGGVALRSRRQLGKEKGVESREKERDRPRGRETPKERSPIKSSRIQARLYPARLSRSRRPHRKLRNTPLALTHTLIITHSPASSLNLSREDGCAHVENEWSLEEDGWSSAALHASLQWVMMLFCNFNKASNHSFIHPHVCVCGGWRLLSFFVSLWTKKTKVNLEKKV